MKKTTLIGVICLCLGLVLLFGSLVLAKGNVKTILANPDDKYTKVEYTCKEDIDSLEIDESSNRVQVIVSDVDHVEVSYMQNKQIDYTIDESNHKLVIKRKHVPFTFHINFGFDFVDEKLLVVVPKKALEYLSIKCSSGTINVSGVDTKDLKVVCTSGSVYIEDINCEKNVFVKATSGSLHLENIKASDIETNVTSGVLKANDIDAKQSFSISGSSGSVYFDNIVSDDISIKVTSGLIKGTIDGAYEDYSIISNVTSGTNNLKDKLEGSKKLNVSTTSGSVKIEFTK